MRVLLKFTALGPRISYGRLPDSLQDMEPNVKTSVEDKKSAGMPNIPPVTTKT